MLATSLSRSGSIKSQLVELFMSVEDMLSYVGKTGEGTVGVDCRSTVSCFEPAQLLGHANGLLDVEGIHVVLAGAVLASARELGLANSDAHSTAFSS